jgi:hypothetical protein
VTTHELAQLLLAGPDLPVGIVDLEGDYHYALSHEGITRRQVRPPEGRGYDDDPALGVPGDWFVSLNDGVLREEGR